MEKIEGELGYFGLADWWLRTFSATERDYIESKYRPLGIGIGERGGHNQRALTKGKISHATGSAAGLLGGLATWFRKAEERDIARRFLEKAEQLARGTDILALHFVYQGMIEISERVENVADSAIVSACMKQISIASKTARAFLKEYPGQPLPAHLGFQELVSVRAKRGEYEEAIRLCEEACRQGWAGDWESWKLQARVDELASKAENALARDDVISADTLFAKIIALDPSQIAAVRKRQAKYYLGTGDEQKAFDFFQLAIEADPLVKGVRIQLRRLAKRLGAEVPSNEGARIGALENKERLAQDWWAKRDLADEYTKVGLRDKAWRLYNEAVEIRTLAGGPCDTIYSHMAKLLEKEGQYREALFHYLLAHNESARFGVQVPTPKFLEKGVDRCLQRLGGNMWNHKQLFEKVGSYVEPSALLERLDDIFRESNQ